MNLQTAFLHFSLSTELSFTQKHALLEKAGTLAHIFYADWKTWFSEWENPPPQNPFFQGWEERTERLAKLFHSRGISWVHCESSEYPDLLKQISQFPFVLFYKGESALLKSDRNLGVVGTRQMSESGLSAIVEFVPHFVLADAVIVSGMAFGVDRAAHEACLEARGKTIAVQAQGVHDGFPSGNKDVYRRILDHGGLVVSEFPDKDFAPSSQGMFPRRNRIISGLSQGLWVVEAALKSGSLVTAAYALQQNRNVYALPGDYRWSVTEGCHALIRQGALCVTKAKHILEDLNWKTEQRELFAGMIKSNHKTPDKFDWASVCGFSDLQIKIVKFCKDRTCFADEISENLNVSIEKVFQELSFLQIGGVINEKNGRFFTEPEFFRKK